MARRRSFIDRLPLAPVFALLFGAAVAIVIAAAPQWRFEQAIAWSGLSSMLAVAQPPLGLKARLLAVTLGFAMVAIVVWAAVMLVERMIAGPKPRASENTDDELDLGGYASELSSVDAPRRPIFADRELGAPFMSDEALATAAPVFITEPSVRAEIPEAEIISEPAPVVDASEEMAGSEPQPAETTAAMDTALEAPLDVAEFDLPPVANETEPVSGESSIDTLIRRLEAGMARRAGPQPPSSPASAANPLTAMRELLALNRENDADNDMGSARALDTLQRLAARRMAG